MVADLALLGCVLHLVFAAEFHAGQALIRAGESRSEAGFLRHFFRGSIHAG